MVNEQRRTTGALIADAGWQRVLTAWMCNGTGTEAAAAAAHSVCEFVAGVRYLFRICFISFDSFSEWHTTRLQPCNTADTAHHHMATASIILHFSMRNVIYVSRAHTKSTFHKSVGIRERKMKEGRSDVWVYKENARKHQANRVFCTGSPAIRIRARVSSKHSHTTHIQLYTVTATTNSLAHK